MTTTMVQMPLREALALVQRGPKPNIDESVRVSAIESHTYWLRSLLKAGLVHGMSTPMPWIETAPFFNPKDPIWEIVRGYFRNELAETMLAPPAQIASVTSLDAADSMKHGAPNLRQRVYRLICEKPRTDEELANILARKENSIRPRRVELVELGLVKAVGKRLSSSRHWMTTWGVNDDGTTEVGS